MARVTPGDPVYSPPPPPVWPPAGAPAGPPPGWYPDPSGVHQLRYWTGYGWTPGVSDNGWVTEDWRQPGPAAAGQNTPPALPGPDTRIHLPKKVFGFALIGIVLALALAVIGATIASVIAPHNTLLALLLSQAGLWAGLLWPVRLASARYGSGNIWKDFGVRAETMDVGRGLGFSIVGRVAGVLVLLPVVALNKRFSGTELQPLKDARHHPAVLVALVLISLVGAPFVEELFFRGLLQRASLPLVGATGAIVLQALVFASLHMRPSYGLGNVAVFLGIAVFGLVQGWMADHYRRLGPGMWSHGFFNLAAVLATTVR
ncbi:MAG TPA: CPBP family glutamic-type intramembrane protease [Actinomycetota bacterium]|nr:CPBP family glutamic-type intramembrane protease [Actinomycetota bacterium]